MRVIAGTARSMPLKSPAGRQTRPTTDRIKETLFNMLQTSVPDCVFLDLFSGSGAIGIEALSRGARRCYFVEQDKTAIECIMENVRFTGMSDRAVIIRADVLGALHQIPEQEADLIFMDPPYGEGLEVRVLQALLEQSYVTEQTRMIVEASLDTEISGLESIGYRVARQKKYKTNQHVFLTRSV